MTTRHQGDGAASGKNHEGPGARAASEDEARTIARERFVARKVKYAQAALSFETLWPRLWALFAVVGLFVVLSAAEIWQYLPAVLHIALLATFALGLGVALVRLILWRLPSRQQALTRIEHASALPHRPLTAVYDTLPAMEKLAPETLALWQAHQARMSKRLPQLQAGSARPRLDLLDPLALRAALILLLCVALVATWGDLRQRLSAAFLVPHVTMATNFRIDAWVTPPAYTHKDPIVLSAQSGSTISVPEGSTLTIKINGSDARSAHVILASGGSEEALKPSSASHDDYAEYTGKITQPGKLSVSTGYFLKWNWAFEIVPDQAPKIQFEGPIEITERAALVFKYKVDDDYGVMSAEARIEHNDGRPLVAVRIGQPPVFSLMLPRAPIKSAEAKTYKDLTSHPWAGLPVTITLIAKDEAGHMGQSAPRGFILPQREFKKPLAKAVIEQRRLLVEKPASANVVAQNLRGTLKLAMDENATSAVYLGLRAVTWRLAKAPSQEDLEEAVDQLWAIALRVEDGDLADAERALRAAQEKLQDAIAHGASSEEIKRLMTELRMALDGFLRAMAAREKAGDRHATGSQNMKMISPQDLKNLLNKIESLMQSGSREEADRLLGKLRDILENLRNAQSGSASAEEEAEALKEIETLAKLARQQQQLLDQTFKLQQNSDNTIEDEFDDKNSDAPHDAASRKAAQSLMQRENELQSDLHAFVESLDEAHAHIIKPKMDEADRSMSLAQDALKTETLPDAIDRETQALNALRQVMRSIAEGMNGGSGSQANSDPLNRGGGKDDGEDDSAQDGDSQGERAQRVRSILDELRKRLGQPSRGADEIEYLERLIKSF